MPPVYHVKRRKTDVSQLFPWDFDPIGKKFFPERGTDFLTDQFAQHSKANVLALRNAKPVGDDDLPTEVNVVYDADQSFTIPVYSLSSPGKWQTQKNADAGLSYDQARIFTLTAAMRILLEYIRVVKRLRDTSIMTTNKTLVAAERFDNYNSGSSLPIDILQNYSDGIADNNQGRRPNVGACAIQTLRAIAKSEQFKDNGVKYNIIPDNLDIENDADGIARIVERMIGMKRGSLFAYDATYNAGTLANPSYKKFIGSDFVMGYVEEMGMMSFTMGVGWKWNVMPDETAIVSVPQFTRGAAVVDEYRVIAPTEPQVVQPSLGALIKGCVDTTNAAYGGKLD